MTILKKQGRCGNCGRTIPAGIDTTHEIEAEMAEMAEMAGRTG